MDPGGGPLSPDDAFWLLGEETRLAILRAVWAAEGGTATFTEIREAVGRPDSGQFNYHLDKLRGPFLAPAEEGYRLTQAGRSVVRAVMAGTITEQPATDPAPIGAACDECGGELVARYDEHGVVECGDCGATVMWNEFPPAGLEERDPGAFAEAFDRWTRSRFRLAMDGVCPNCAAAMSAELEPRDPGPDESVASYHRCPNCRYEARVPLTGHVVDHPAVVSFYHQMGRDVADMPYWEWRSIAESFDVVVDPGEPWRATIALTDGGRRLELVLDGELDVIHTDLSDE